MNSKAMSVPRQRGAVLVFSLIMLTLLTLVSVSMIQHNKQELAMTGNTLEQTKSLARAETELTQAEQVIDTTRLDPADPANRKCNILDANQINENQVILTTATGEATVTAVYCLTASKIQTQCTFTSGVRDDIAACTCNDGTEIYTVKWVSTADSNYGSQRTVESNYAVDCSAGQF